MSGDKVDAALRLAAAITAKRAELGAMEAEFRGLFAEPPPAAARRGPPRPAHRRQPRKNGKDAAGRLYPKTRKPPRKPGEPVPECSSPEGCLRPAFSKGLCAKHYRASWRAAKGRPSRAKPRAGLNGVSLLAGGGGGAASEEE